MAMWNPWRGCHKFSEGCQHCYIHKGDARKGIQTDDIRLTKSFHAPIQKNANGDYRMKANQMVYLCFSTDFLIEDADSWRGECWEIIKERQDLHFLFLTKRIERFMDCIPNDWDDGYENVSVGCTVENQKQADFRLSIFATLPIKHKVITAQPLLENVDMSNYLDGIEEVVVGGESDRNARPLHYDWVLHIRQQCIDKNVPFTFRQCGTHFVKDEKTYTLPVSLLTAQAKKANINTH